MKCPNCNKLLLPENEYYYEDFGIDGEGIVHVYTCEYEKCNTEQVQVFMNLNDEDEK